MLEGAVGEEGTGQLAADPRLPRGGQDRHRRTATTPKLGRYDGYTATFVGLRARGRAPARRAVVLQNPQKGHYGGQVAAPVFKDVMTFAMQEQEDSADRLAGARRCGSRAGQ